METTKMKQQGKLLSCKECELKFISTKALWLHRCCKSARPEKRCIFGSLYEVLDSGWGMTQKRTPRQLVGYWYGSSYVPRRPGLTDSSGEIANGIVSDNQERNRRPRMKKSESFDESSTVQFESRKQRMEGSQSFDESSTARLKSRKPRMGASQPFDESLSVQFKTRKRVVCECDPVEGHAKVSNTKVKSSKRRTDGAHKCQISIVENPMGWAPGEHKREHWKKKALSVWQGSRSEASVASSSTSCANGI